MPAFKKLFDLLDDDIIELFTENESLKNKIDCYDRKCLEESNARLLKHLDCDKRANLILSRLRELMKKH